MARDESRKPVTEVADHAERLEAARAVVYNEDGELIAPAEIERAIERVGVVVSTDEDGTTVYDNVPPELPLAACHLAVDLRRDPADFVHEDAP